MRPVPQCFRSDGTAVLREHCRNALDPVAQGGALRYR